MASLISGFEYDIFISYRQKDNKHDGWVTEFVNHLKGELEATFKEDISIYFDENPHDRLQETYNVNKSLEGKLKCLIFAPILSQTYCDPASYAWQNEFLSFIRLTGDDRFGRDIKLRSGNVASRILPIRIHDLDPDDVKLFEKETGGVMRAMDFVFRTSSGVNRPLRANEDHPNDNLNKTFYRDQINKVANAIKEIIQGLKAEAAPIVKEIEKQSKPDAEVVKEVSEREAEKITVIPRPKSLSGILITAALVIILAAVILPKILHTDKNKIIKDGDGRISIVVNDFNNSSNDTTLNNLKIAIPDILRNDLSGPKELLVQNSQTMYELYQSMGQDQKASIIPSASRDAAIKLNAGAFVTGSFQKIGDTILILAELNDTRSGEVLWSGNIKGIKDSYPVLAFSISGQLKSFLEIKALKQQINPEFGEAYTSSPEAYRKYIDGMYLIMKMNWPAALQSFQDAFRIDSTFSLAAFYTAYIYCYTSDFKNAIEWTRKAYLVRQNLPYDYKTWVEMWNACYILSDLDEIIKYCNLLELSEIKSRYFWWDLGVTYEECEVFDKAVKAFEKVETITNEWGKDWKYTDYYWRFGFALHNEGFHDKEGKIYEKGLTLFPDYIWIIYCQALCAISQGDTVLEARLLTQFFKMAKDNKMSDSRIETNLGNIYAEANSLDKAEEHYHNSLKLDPKNYQYMNNLAKFLIHYNRKIDEAGKLSDQVLSIKADDPNALWVKGMVYYNQGKYKEALDLVKKAKESLGWNTWLEKDIKKVKEAIARQN